MFSITPNQNYFFHKKGHLEDNQARVALFSHQSLWTVLGLNNLLLVDKQKEEPQDAISQPFLANWE